MQCPKCGSTNVTTAGLGTGVWVCMRDACGTKFDRDKALARAEGRKLSGHQAA